MCLDPEKHGYQGSFPVVCGPGFSRRGFFRVAGTAIAGSFLYDALGAPARAHASPSVALQGTARNAVVVFLAGGPSHVDTFDLKEGSWTPPELKPTTYGGNVRFPQGLMPKMADQLGRVAIIRSALSWAAVHSLAQIWAQISRNPTGALGNIAPHVGAVVALETQAQRGPNDILPGFVSLNTGGSLGAGYLPAKYAPFRIAARGDGLSSLTPQGGDMARFQRRAGLIEVLDADRGAEEPLGRNASAMDEFYRQARTLMESPEAAAYFRYSAEEQARYGNSTFGSSLVIARNLLAANRGARFVQVTQGGWDMHSNIYAAQGTSLFTLCPPLDNGLAAFLDDLAGRPGATAGKSLLDETLVLVFGEFGRTVGSTNAQGGRDHFLRQSIVMAGGGVKGGRIIGETDAMGSKVKEFGWSGNRDVRIEDVTCTLYSALGIDYTTVRKDDPVGRGFEYVPFAGDGVYKPVDEVF